jgi:hypothetical protein
VFGFTKRLSLKKLWAIRFGSKPCNNHNPTSSILDFKIETGTDHSSILKNYKRIQNWSFSQTQRTTPHTGSNHHKIPTKLLVSKDSDVWVVDNLLFP